MAVTNTDRGNAARSRRSRSRDRIVTSVQVCRDLLDGTASGITDDGGKGQADAVRLMLGGHHDLDVVGAHQSPPGTTHVDVKMLVDGTSDTDHNERGERDLLRAQSEGPTRPADVDLERTVNHGHTPGELQQVEDLSAARRQRLNVIRATLHLHTSCHLAQYLGGTWRVAGGRRLLTETLATTGKHRQSLSTPEPPAQRQ